MCYACAVQRKISQREFRNNSGEIMRAVAAGVSFLVTRNGVPVGELRPIRDRRFVRKEDAFESARGLEPIDLERLRADLDAVLSQDIMPRA
jgi:prevent-host-death family protein